MGHSCAAKAASNEAPTNGYVASKAGGEQTAVADKGTRGYMTSLYLRWGAALIDQQTSKDAPANECVASAKQAAHGYLALGEPAPLCSLAPQMGPVRVIFLDCDGVLHPHPLVDDDEPFFPSCVQSLKKIVTAGTATLVLSSSWREHKSLWKELNKQLQRVGLQAIVDATPISEAGTADNFVSRSDEIIEWLMKHPSVTNFLAIDDSDLCDPHGEAFGKHFVKTSSRTGLTDSDIPSALRKLDLQIDRSTLPAPGRVKLLSSSD